MTNITKIQPRDIFLILCLVSVRIKECFGEKFKAIKATAMGNFPDFLRVKNGSRRPLWFCLFVVALLLGSSVFWRVISLLSQQLIPAPLTEKVTKGKWL